MARAKDITGQRFGRLVVAGKAGKNKWGAVLWNCLCDCGGTNIVATKDLNGASTRSCGCLKRPPVRSRHGMARSPEYQAWRNMRARCSSRSYRDWHNYGGRGISVCERWLTFENFYADMGLRPSALHSLDRINPDGNYEPSNCRWASEAQQHNNQRHSHFVTAFGKRQTIGQWAKETGIGRAVIGGRLARGWTAERAVSTAVHREPPTEPHRLPPE